MTIKKITKCVSEFNGKLGEEIEVNLRSLEQITRLTTWSPYQFNRIQRYKQDGTPYTLMRLKQNFKQADFFAIDIDQGLNLEQAKERLINLDVRAFINTSGSHTPNNHRFRIVFELNKPIKTKNEILGTFFKLKNIFPELDDACKDEARFFKQSKDFYYLHDSNKLLEPETFEAQPITPVSAEFNGFRLSLTTEDFINNAQPEGERHEALVKACMNAGQQGWSEAEFRSILKLDVNPWLKEEKHSKHITDIFSNQRWGQKVPTLYGEKETKVSGNLQNKWALLWLKNKRAVSTYDGQIIIDGKPSARSKILRDMRLDSASSNMVMSSSLFDDILDKFIDNNKDNYLEAVKIKLNPYKPQGEYELQRFLEILCGENIKEMDVKILQHFIWNVKRRLNGLNTYREVMPVIQGFQGIGKSYNIRENLLAPLSDLSKQSTFKQLEDGREMRLLTDNFVLFFDEMSYAGLADIDNIKRLITETKLSVRRMRETDHDLLIKNAQFIGCSNKNLINIITDATGMRRFYEITCRPKKSIPDILEFYEEFNKLDYELMWQSVDHNAPAPIVHDIDKLDNIQNEYVTKHPIDEWIEDSGEVEITEDAVSKAKELVDNLNQWATNYKYSPQRLGKHLTDPRYIGKIIRERKVDGYYYNIKIVNKPIGEF